MLKHVTKLRDFSEKSLKSQKIRESREIHRKINNFFQPTQKVCGLNFIFYMVELQEAENLILAIIETM